jgi:hypothetical protein
MINRLLNTMHAILHPRKHVDGSNNAGWVTSLTAMFTRREPMVWVAVRWCPVCTLAALWAWFKE